ncbi:hypothetical protein A7J50_2560 [Pseudomonas antarctica]|uniref:Uncharacterized protein n=1 Tax=Pseudomonas antarctica TaxID=219572 RepID=A0A172Z1R6_9PSED|nr:hypothetical protein [Pseudomonas antarctica]ANF85959.1 hypothetical protein A7J50_2560 [Pseudomonas antarctica]
MSVRLDQVPALALRPVRPRAWLWLGVLPLLLLLLGLCGTFLFGTQTLRQQPVSFWGLALGVPLLGWCLLACVRALLYCGQQQVADGWDKAREEDLIQKFRRGRRVQQVLGVALLSAVREPEAPSVTQLNALLGGVKALKAQPPRHGQTTFRHSRIAGVADEETEQALRRVVMQVLADLVPILEQAPDDRPLALLLEVDSALPQNVLQQIWRQAWSESGIRQSTVPIEGFGLKALDQWLDHRIFDEALLLVVAIQFAPQQPEGTAEVAVGLLLGNRLTQTVLPPKAYLHRPEQEREPTTEALLYAARQALDWVPIDAQSIEQIWRVGIDVQRVAALTKVLVDVSLQSKHNQGVCNLDTVLGHPGKASPWLAIAAATQTIQSGAGPQFIFSGGDCVDAGLWSTVLTPVLSLSK